MRKKGIPPLQSYCLVSMCISFSFALGSIRHVVSRIQTQALFQYNIGIYIVKIVKVYWGKYISVC